MDGTPSHETLPDNWAQITALARGDGALTPLRTRDGHLLALTQQHKRVARLLAEGKTHEQVADEVKWSLEHIERLLLDPLFDQCLRKMIVNADQRLEAMYLRVVEVIGEKLESTDEDIQLKAARLQLEVTGRIGKGERPGAGAEDSINRLTRLAERLVALNGGKSKKEVIDVEVQTQ